MSTQKLSGLFLGVVLVAQSLYILLVRPDPPPTARTATRTSRRLVAIGSLLIALSLIIVIVLPE